MVRAEWESNDQTPAEAAAAAAAAMVVSAVMGDKAKCVGSIYDSHHQTTNYHVIITA